MYQQLQKICRENVCRIKVFRANYPCTPKKLPAPTPTFTTKIEDTVHLASNKSNFVLNCFNSLIALTSANRALIASIRDKYLSLSLYLLLLWNFENTTFVVFPKRYS